MDMDNGGTETTQVLIQIILICVSKVNPTLMGLEGEYGARICIFVVSCPLKSNFVSKIILQK